ncbi:hypothetical protein Tco_1377212 [Tanacetum coccineum]
MGKSTRNKRRLFENHQINYFDEGPSLNNGQPLTQKEVVHEATAIDIYKRFYILEEARPKLDGEIKQEEEEEAVKRVMGEALKEKECDNCALSRFMVPCPCIDETPFSLMQDVVPLFLDDIHEVTPCVSALAGCDKLVSEPLVIEK